MRILCVGRQGDSRSVALAYLLKQKGHVAIAVGMRRMDRGTRKMMLDWAELIIVLHAKCQEGVPEEYIDKLKIWQIGRDVYFQEPNENLKGMLEGYIKREGL